MPFSQFKETIHRITPQRKLILEQLRALKTHPTAIELYKKVCKKNPKINLVTIYRNLEFLEKYYLVLKLKSKDKESRYDGNPEKHCHLICQCCGKVKDLFDVKDIRFDSKEMNNSGFKLCLDNLEIYGICKNCQK